MVQLSFKQTKAEIMVRIASTLLFNQLVKANSRIVSVREITENIQYGYTEKASESEIGPKYVRITDLKDGRVNWDTVPYCKCNEPEQYLLKQNDLIFARTGATTGKTHLFRDVPPYAVFASYLIRVRPTKEINPEYLYYFFQSDLYWSQVSSHKEGSAQPNVNGQKLSVIELPVITQEIQKAVCKFLAVVRARQDGINQELPELPQPLMEQRRIVAHIKSLAARVNEAQRLREEADKEARSFLNSALSKTTQDLLANHEPQTLEALTLFVGDMNHDMPNGQESGIPFISPKDFTTNARINFDGAKKITREDFERLSQKACPQKGDILMARYGTIGAARYVDTDREFLASYSIAIIRPNPELVDERFLYWMSISPYVQEQAIKGIRGSGMADLGLKTIRQFIIPHLNFDEQRHIVAYLDGVQAKVNALREYQSASGEELSALMPSVLDRAFKGEL